MLLKQAVMVIRRPLLPRKVQMVALMLEAGPTKSAVEAVEQVKLAQPELLAARQEMAETELPAVLEMAVQFTMLEEEAVLQLLLGVLVMGDLGVEELEARTASQTLVAAAAAAARAVQASLL